MDFQTNFINRPLFFAFEASHKSTILKYFLDLAIDLGSLTSSITDKL